MLRKIESGEMSMPEEPTEKPMEEEMEELVVSKVEAEEAPKGLMARI